MKVSISPFRLLTWLFNFLGLCCFQLHADCGLEGLPVYLHKWMESEQTRPGPYFASLSKKSISVYKNDDQRVYAPHKRPVFELPSYWVTEEDAYLFSAPLPVQGEQRVLKNLERQFGGQKEYRFFIHPESQGFYQDLKDRSLPAPSLCATPTSSYRTLLVWSEEPDFEPFFAKLTIDQVIGGEVRHVSAADASLAIGTHRVLSLSPNRYPEGFAYLPEVLGILPKVEASGMIIRLVPEEVRWGKKELIPLFALYGTPQNGEVPYLVEMINRSGQPPKEFVIERLLDKFARIWVQLAVNMGVAPEAHGQNTLLGIGKDGLIDGTFYWRDLDGCGVDLRYHEYITGNKHLELPYLDSIEKEYNQSPRAIRYWVYHSLWWFNDVVNVINLKLMEWMKQKQIPSEPLVPRELESVLLQKLHSEWVKITGKQQVAPRTVRYMALRVAQYWEKHRTSTAFAEYGKQ